MANRIHSFVYVDYGVTSEELDEQLLNNGFAGYKIAHQRNVEEHEITPNGWNPKISPEEQNDYRRKNPIPPKPFCKWIIFERADNVNSGHGPKRFSVLYLCADGVAAFQALYTAGEVAPDALGIIQPGTGFGGNWTDFTDEKGPLARSVSENPAGRPRILLHGGSGGSKLYVGSCWPRHYPNFLGLVEGAYTNGYSVAAFGCGQRFHNTMNG